MKARGRANCRDADQLGREETAHRLLEASLRDAFGSGVPSEHRRRVVSAGHVAERAPFASEGGDQAKEDLVHLSGQFARAGASCLTVRQQKVSC